MASSLPILLELAKDDASSVRDLAPSFVSVLKQITEHRLPRDFDYHRIPAPWIQIHLLKILGHLGNADQTTSEHMYEVLHQVMKRADTGINVGYAIVYECIRTITRIYPNKMLLDSAAASIARFIGSNNQNLKYFGVTALSQIVKEHPEYAGPHQMIVLDCLEDPDETIQRRTLDLLYSMTTPKNVKIVVTKMQNFLKKSKDQFLREELVRRLTTLAERFAPDAIWYIETMTSVIEAGGDLVEAKAAHNLRKLIAEGSGDEDEDEGTACVLGSSLMAPRSKARPSRVRNHGTLLPACAPVSSSSVCLCSVGGFGAGSGMLLIGWMASKHSESFSRSDVRPQFEWSYLWLLE